MDESIQKHLKPKLNRTRKLLLKAAALMEKHGLNKGDLEDGHGRICTLKALIRAGNVEHWADWRTNKTLAAALRKFMRAIGVSDTCASNICPWNNEEERTTESVSAKLRAVALGL